MGSLVFESQVQFLDLMHLAITLSKLLSFIVLESQCPGSSNGSWCLFGILFFSFLWVGLCQRTIGSTYLLFTARCMITLTSVMEFSSVSAWRSETSRSTVRCTRGICGRRCVFAWFWALFRMPPMPTARQATWETFTRVMVFVSTSGHEFLGLTIII